MNGIEYNITLTLVLALFGASFSATALYGAFSPWWTHRTGVGLFTTLFALTIVTGLNAWQWFWPLNIYVAWGAYGLMILALMFMGCVIGREQVLGRRSRRRKAAQ